MPYAEYIYSEFATKAQLLPFNAVQMIWRVADGAISDKNLVFYHLERESNFRFSPITRNHFKRGAVFLGWNLECTCYLSFNEEAFAQAMYGHSSGFLTEPVEIRLLLGNAQAWSESPHSVPNRINSTGSLTIIINNKRMNITWEQETVEYRIRHILKIKGFAKRSDLTYE